MTSNVYIPPSSSRRSSLRTLGGVIGFGLYMLGSAGLTLLFYALCWRQ